MVKAYAEMIRDISGENEAKRKIHANVIIEEADRLSNLVCDMLDLSKIQSGTDEMVFQPLVRSVEFIMFSNILNQGPTFVLDLELL